MVSAWVWVTVGIAAPCLFLMASGSVYAFNEQSGCGNSLWVCLLWSVGASDVVSVWVWVTMGVAAPCWCLLFEGCVWLISKVGVAALCGCVSLVCGTFDVVDVWGWVTVGVAAPW